MDSSSYDFSLGIAGAAGQGIATPGDILARTFAKLGLHIFAYNAHQSLIRGGHILLTMRVTDCEVGNHGDRLDLLVVFNQEGLDRHLGLLRPGSAVIYNNTLVPDAPPPGVQLCPVPLQELTGRGHRLTQNSVTLGVITSLMRLKLNQLEQSIEQQFRTKGEKIAAENVKAARAGYDYAAPRFTPFALEAPTGRRKLGLVTGNSAMALGMAAAGVKYYAAYPMSPATGILHWMAAHARDLGIMVRQAEDEITVINQVIGAAHGGCRAACATSGGGFALMTEALGMAGIMELPIVVVNVQRGGPSTGLPTKTEQGDLWQALGASQGDYPRLIVAPATLQECFDLMPELFNLTDHYQCPAIVLSDQYLGEATGTVDVKTLDLQPVIDRGRLDTADSAEGDYLRYRHTPDGISLRTIPGVKGRIFVASSDEHDESGNVISDVFTNPTERRRMVEKRRRKLRDLPDRLAPPELEGPAEAEVTLVGWGSTQAAIREARRQLAASDIVANQLHVRWMVPLHTAALQAALAGANRTIMVEQNESGQFARYLRSETGLAMDAHIRKYDGEPFMPHHITDGVREILNHKRELYVPRHEVRV